MSEQENPAGAAQAAAQPSNETPATVKDLRQIEMEGRIAKDAAIMRAENARKLASYAVGTAAIVGTGLMVWNAIKEARSEKNETSAAHA